MKKERNYLGCRRLFKSMFLVLVLIALCLLPSGLPISLRPVVASAYGESELEETSGSCGESVTWTFDSSTGVLTISGTGKFGKENDQDSPFYKKTNIKKVIVKAGITEVGYSAFVGCNNLTEVVLPSTLKKIGNYAFQDCSELTEIDLPDSVTELGSCCFSGCKKLTVTKLPANLESFGWRFIDGTQTKSITIPGSVKKIEYRVFSGCQLDEIILEEGVEELGQEAFGDSGITEIHLPASIKEIRSDSMICRTLQSITIDPRNQKYSCKDGVLYNSNKSELKAYPAARTGSFKVPKGVTKIGADAFYATKLDSVTFPDTVTSIGAASFRSSSIKRVNVPKKVKEIGIFAFDGCPDLEAITVDSENDTFKSVDGVLYSKDMTILYRFPSAKTGVYRLPDSVAEIDEFACDNCGLTRMVLPRNLKIIGEYAFRNSNSLTDLVIPESVTDLEMNIFSNCSNLEHLVILSRDFTAYERVYNLYYFPALLRIYGYPDAKINGQLLSEYLPQTFNNSVFYTLSPIKDVSGVKSVNPASSMKLTVPSAFGDTEWMAADPTIASVSKSGKLTSIEGGLTDVFAMNGDEARHYRVLTGFSDVKNKDYFSTAVYWAKDAGITSGVKNPESGLFETFEPQKNCTRAQMVAFLWRMAGCPEPKNTRMVFTDVKSNAYYYKAVLWGVEKGIVGGYSDKTFRPNNQCTRQQAVTFLWRYYNSPKPTASTSKFTDVTNKKAYYYDAVLWATEKGITGGYSDGTFRPDNTCSRAQMVTFLHRSCH